MTSPATAAAAIPSRAPVRQEQKRSCRYTKNLYAIFNLHVTSCRLQTFRNDGEIMTHSASLRRTAAVRLHHMTNYIS